MMLLPFALTMDTPMIEEIRELFQNFIAPQLESIKGEIKGLDSKIGALDSKIVNLDKKIDWMIDSLRRELLAEIRRVEEVLSTDFVRLEEKVDLRLANVDTKLEVMNEKLELHRRELLAEIRAALK